MRLTHALRPFPTPVAGPLPGDAADQLRREQEAPDVDSDRDGVPDETERWLGTSTFTDESGVEGRTDAGSTASVTRMERAWERDRAALYGGVRGAPTSAETRSKDAETAPFARTALGVRLALLIKAQGGILRP